MNTMSAGNRAIVSATTSGIRQQILTALVLMGMFSTSVMAGELKFTRIFSDNMVLQCDVPAPVWGWADPGEKITVQFNGQEKSAIAGADGKLMVRLEPLTASCEPKILTVTGKTDKKEFKNVVVGEVWVCSGQSNMEANFKQLGLLNEIKDVNYPMIRIVGFISQVNPIPTEFIWPGFSWNICNTNNTFVIQGFPCVPYYFALYLWKELKVPIGVIHASAGSSSIEAWMPPESFAANESWKEQLADIEKVQKQYREYSGYSLDEKERIAIEISKDKYGCIMESRLRKNMTAEEAEYFLAEKKRIAGEISKNKDGIVLESKLHKNLTAEEAEYFFRFSLLLRPACLYNYKIRPLISYAMRGAIWYQGGTDTYRMKLKPGYADKQKALVETWRKLWGQGDFPFYFVQTAPYHGFRDMLEFWLEQYKAVSAVKNSAMITTVDIGDINNCHPKNKKDVGLRLALLALKNTYGRKGIVASGPVYKSMKITDGKITVAFDWVGGGLATKDGKEPDSFEVAGADGRFCPAKAVITGDKVTVSSPDVVNPQHVRYAWSYVANPNLRNKEGLGAFPFSTEKLQKYDIGGTWAK